MDDRYRGVFGRRDVLFVNREDLAARGLAHGDTVDVETVPHGESATPTLCVRGLTAVEHNIPRGTVAAYYPEANGLVALSHHDKSSGTPSYKSVLVLVKPAAEAHAMDAA
jgi:anaerobic selenocysteine-containing dehydrogenase